MANSITFTSTFSRTQHLPSFIDFANLIQRIQRIVGPVPIVIVNSTESGFAVNLVTNLTDEQQRLINEQVEESVPEAPQQPPPILAAIFENDVDCIEELFVDGQACRETKNEGGSLLYIAITNKMRLAAQKLMELGCELDSEEIEKLQNDARTQPAIAQILNRLGFEVPSLEQPAR